jgi:hypothetical protein
MRFGAALAVVAVFTVGALACGDGSKHTAQTVSPADATRRVFFALATVVFDQYGLFEPNYCYNQPTPSEVDRCFLYLDGKRSEAVRALASVLARYEHHILNACRGTVRPADQMAGSLAVIVKKALARRTHEALETAEGDYSYPLMQIGFPIVLGFKACAPQESAL